MDDLMNYGLRRFSWAGFILWVRGDKRAIQQLFSLLSCVFLGPCCFIDSGFCDFLVEELSFAGPPRCPTWYGRCYRPRGERVQSSSSLAAGKTPSEAIQKAAAIHWVQIQGSQGHRNPKILMPSSTWLHRFKVWLNTSSIIIMIMAERKKNRRGDNFRRIV